MIIMSPSALDAVTRLNIPYPLLFSLRNPVPDRTTHCGTFGSLSETVSFIYIIINWIGRKGQELIKSNPRFVTFIHFIGSVHFNRSVLSGVLEFVAEEGRIYIPYWMFSNLCLQEGQRVTVKSGNLPKGDFVKFQPLSPEFNDIHNPKVSKLISLACLSVP